MRKQWKLQENGQLILKIIILVFDHNINNNLFIYPNPSIDIFNITFTSEQIQDLKVKVLNVLGEEVINENLEQFIGEYTKAIDLATYTKGVYFLEITTNDGVVNKKLILQ